MSFLVYQQRYKVKESFPQSALKAIKLNDFPDDALYFALHVLLFALMNMVLPAIPDLFM